MALTTLHSMNRRPCKMTLHGETPMQVAGLKVTRKDKHENPAYRG